MRGPHASALAVLLVLAVPATAVRAQQAPPAAASGSATPAAPGRAARWFRDHALLEVSAVAAWRTAVRPEENAPGFQALYGGGDVGVGSEIGAGVGVLVGARGGYGRAGGKDYAELTGNLTLQLHLTERVRLRVGGDGGRAWLRPTGERATLVGGFVATAIDVAAVAGGALMLMVRLDVDGLLDAPPILPGLTLGFGVGIGGRY